MQISVKSNVKQVAKGLNSFQKKQIPFATSQALNDTAFDVMRAEKKHLDKYIDKPTPFTKRGIMVEKSSKRKLIATVYFEKKRAKYMQYQIKGGTRRPDNKAILIPTDKIRRNKYGNISKSARDKLFNSPKFFNSRGGVYERYGPGGSKQRRVANFVSKAKYKPLLPFAAIGRAGAKTFDKHFSKRLARAIATAK